MSDSLTDPLPESRTFRNEPSGGGPCNRVVQVVAHTFELVSADDYTLNYMESRSHEGWPRSNIYRILDAIRPHTAQVRWPPWDAQVRMPID